MTGTKTWLLLAVVAGLWLYQSDWLTKLRHEQQHIAGTSAEQRLVLQLVAKNLEARGGEQAWQAVSALAMRGKMDVGQGMRLPFRLEQQRPDKLRLEYDFNSATAVFTFDGEQGWKWLPFHNKLAPESMTAEELQQISGAEDFFGVLYHFGQRNILLEYQGETQVDNRAVHKLKVTLPGGALRWLYLDKETGLEVKLESQRILRGQPHLVETRYLDWRAVDGLLIAHRQESRTEGEQEWHAFTIDRVEVNPRLDDTRFVPPSALPAQATAPGK